MKYEKKPYETSFLPLGSEISEYFHKAESLLRS